MTSFDPVAGVLRMLDAKSVAVVGASGDPNKIGYLPIDYLVRFGYPGRVYPVNPRLTEVNGLRCYPSISVLPEVPDLVAIMVAAPKVAGVVEEAGIFGVPFAVVITAGFSEAGSAGIELQRQVVDAAASSGIQICGPNSVGVISTANRMPVTFTSALRQGSLTEPGNIGIVSQSGAFGTVLYGLARDQGLALHTYISTGNEAQLGVPDYIAAMVRHPAISTIGGYVETIRDGPAFADAALAARHGGIPVVLVKVGASAAGTSAAASHTGSLTGNDVAYQAAFNRFGVARAVDEQHLLDVLEAFNVMPNMPEGNRLAIASMSGGAGVLLCDAADEHGLAVPPFPSEVVERLRKVLPPFAAAENPVDFTGQFVTNPVGLETVLSELAAVGDVVILFAGFGWTAEGAWVDPVVAASDSKTPIVVVSPLATDEQRGRLRDVGVPVYASPLQAIRVLETLVTWNSWVPPGDAVPLEPPDMPAPLSEAVGKSILAGLGLSVPKGQVVHSATEAHALATDLGGQVAMKVLGLAHKTEAGAVRLGVTPDEAEVVYHELLEAVSSSHPDAPVGGVLVEEMITGGLELVVGATWQEPFGHVMMVGMGGVGVELLGDTVFGLAPFGRDEARTMIESLKSYPLLNGYRGATPADVEALAETFSIVSRLAAGMGSKLVELDLNPIRVLPVGEGAIVLDFLAILD